jgi:hypothetical protein
MTSAIKIDLSEKEFMALAEFARMCGESIPDLVKKIVMRDVTLSDGHDTGNREYEFQMKLSIEGTHSQDRRQLEANYNKIIRIMGLNEIRL